MTRPNFIIGGVNKAGTSSVFAYLNSHPDVCGSSRKEVNFFRAKKADSSMPSLDAYEAFFRDCSPEKKIIFEASPLYLQRGAPVARQILDMNPDVRLLFVLREPASRMYSFYNFRAASNKFNLDITFSEYVDKCFAYTLKGEPASILGLTSKQLSCLETGRYARYLREFLEVVPRKQIRVMFLENLKASPQKFMRELCVYLGIDGAYYSDFEFRKVNETIDTKSKQMHKLALRLNNQLETFFHRRPALKARLVGIYKHLNRKPRKSDPVPESVQERLREFYLEPNSELAALLSDYDDLPDWVRGDDAV